MVQSQPQFMVEHNEQNDIIDNYNNVYDDKYIMFTVSSTTVYTVCSIISFLLTINISCLCCKAIELFKQRRVSKL